MRASDEMHGRVHLAEVMTGLAGALKAPTDLDTALAQITRCAVGAMDHADAASISLTQPNGSIKTYAPTDEWVYAADSLQYRLRQGPCFYVATHQVPCVLVDSLESDSRWPDYGPLAAELGIGSQVAFRLQSPQGQSGSLNVYARASQSFVDADSRSLGDLFASQVALALGWIRQQATIEEALASRTVIGQATGIVMERYRLDADAANRYLVRVSQNTNTKLRLVAEGIVTDTIQPNSHER